MRAGIFDIDGTLVDSVDLHARAWQEALHHFGHDLPFDQIRGQIGKGGDQFLPVFLSREEMESRGEEIQRYRGDLFMRQYMPQVRPFPDVRALFQKMIGHGWKIALASSAKEKELNIYKDIAHISDLVESQASSEDADKSKPHPDIFLAAAERLDISPQDCIAVGDTPYDAEAAAKAGIRSLAYYAAASRKANFARRGARKCMKAPPIYSSAMKTLCSASPALIGVERSSSAKSDYP
jgi:HAD superfamily hydrolase (TIGR01509 family)